MIAAILLADMQLDVGGSPLALQLADDGRTLLEWQVAEILAGGAEVVEVVLGHNAAQLLPLLTGGDVEPIINDAWQQGEAGSIRVGATATPRNTGTALLVWLTHPREASVIGRVLDEHRSAAARVTRPLVGGAPETPVVVDDAVLARLRNMPEGMSVADLLRDYDALVVPMPGPMPAFTGPDT